MNSGDQSSHRDLTAARATLEEFERRRRAARTELERWRLDQAIDYQRAVVRRAEKTLSFEDIKAEFKVALASVDVKSEDT